ncbi:phosphopantetheine adenylyltransferase [Lactobacillus koreensis] [Leuconostoc pseudomesenteroides]|nr:phosphopantetheine adenylyltransferase [Lactobacillus koreensis] [Leuconostoc pseudomesenteroides]
MSGLTVQFMAEIGAKYIVRGLRNGKDFEYERDIAGVNNADLLVLLPTPTTTFSNK